MTTTQEVKHKIVLSTFPVNLHLVRLLREELGLLQQPGSYVGEVVKVMGTKKVLVKVHPEGKYGTMMRSSSQDMQALTSIQSLISPIMSTSPSLPLESG